jgi:hypothetical protein
MIESGYYPAGSEHDPDAPWNEVEVPEKDFDVTISQSLSRDITVTTNNYVPGASGVDYEPDDEGGYCSCGWQDSDDTSDTDWAEVYKENGHLTPIQLIELFKERCELELKSLDNSDAFELTPLFYKKKKRELKHLIEECEGWTNDETEIVES